MIEFRVHEGKVQYRTWEVYVCNVDGTVRVSYDDDGDGNDAIAWTEWQDVPVSNGDPRRAMFCKHEEVHVSADRAFCAKCNAEL